jgi:hypothetical protein
VLDVHYGAAVHIWKDFNEIGDKQLSKLENLAKYVHLQEVGTFQIIISVTLTILQQSSDNILK